MKRANIFRLLFVLLPITVIGCFLAFNDRTDRDFPSRRTAIEEKSFATALNLYFNAYNSIPTGNAKFIERVLNGEDLDGKNPRKIQFLVLNTNRFDSNGNYLDPWQTPYSITMLEQTNFTVRSAGPNQKFDDADDIIFNSLSNDFVKP